MKSLLLATVAFVPLAGCALVDPYSPGLKAGLYKADGFVCPEGADKMAGESALRCAMARGLDLQTNYLRAAGQHEIARTISAGAIIGGASYALLMGVADGIGPANSTEQIAAIGAGAAAIVGLNSLITSPRRQDAYIAGAKAAICAQLAASPFMLTADDYLTLRSATAAYADHRRDAASRRLGLAVDDAYEAGRMVGVSDRTLVDLANARNESDLSEADLRNRIEAFKQAAVATARRDEQERAAVTRALNELLAAETDMKSADLADNTIADAAAEVHKLLTLFTAAGDPPAGSEDRAIVVAARESLEAAKTTIVRGRSLQQEVDSVAPARLRATLQKVDAAVNAELRKAQPDINAILATQAGLSTIAGRISPKFAATGAAGEASGENGTQSVRPVPGEIPLTRDKLRAALTDAVASLNARVMTVDALVSAVNTRVGEIGKIEDCNFSAVTIAMTMAPEEFVFTKETKGSFAFEITAGEAPFHARFAAPPKGLTVTFVDRFSNDGSASLGRIGTVDYDGDDKIDARDYPLFVTDKTGESATAIVKVNAKQP